MELLVGIAVLAVFVSVWIGLAVASVQKGRPIFVLGALIVPFPAFFIGIQVARRLLASADPDDLGSGDFGRALGAVVTVIAVSILSSYLVLAVGAAWPSPKTTLHTRWRRLAGSGDRRRWEQGPDFSKLDDAREWTEDMAGQPGISTVQVFTKGPLGAYVVATIEVPAQHSGTTNGEVEANDDP